MQKTLLSLAILGLSSHALAQVQGVVSDPQGHPIANASVEVLGTQLRTRTNEKGEFNLPKARGKEIELHIEADDFAHGSFHVQPGSSQNFVLKTSVIETVNVIGLPLHSSNLESAHPVNVITLDELRDQQSSSLGETLKYEVGIHSSYFSSNSASPIIRGLDGPRVLITQNGLDASDASRVGPDHAVSTETSYAQQVEVLRGPATLFYGSGAIGGVVNVVDDRIPKAADTYGEWRLENQSVADDKLISASGNTGLGNFGLHADGFWRDADDYKIPGPAEAEHDHEEEEGHEDNSRLVNSWTEASGGNIGGSYLGENGFIGASIGHIDRQYGIPGHGHGEELIDVYADITQDRIQLHGKTDLNSNWFSSTGFSAGYTDYEHAEIEGDEVGTTFKNETSELRWEVFHHAISDWRGALSFHYKHSDFEAVGEEAFTPPSETETFALGFMEERHINSVLLQVSGRIEQVNITAENFQADLNDPDAAEKFLSVFSVDHESTPVSFSTGAVWDFTLGYNTGISFTHAQRSPAASELFSFGPHIGSGLYEVGYLMEVQTNEHDEFYFALNDSNIELEKSNNLDLSLRKHSGNFGFVLNAFVNQVDNFYYLNNSGFIKELEHHHDHEEEDHEDTGHEEEVEMPVFIYQSADVDLWGYEAEAVWKINPDFELTFKTDSTRAEVDESSHLPRIPPRRYSISGEYEKNQWRIQLTAQHYTSQNRITELETPTDSYSTLDMILSYSFMPDVQLFVKGYNLTDEYARVHSSFLKDKAPLPARNIAVGISGRF
ncbi:MAG: TonB-dependent receptor [Cellvibrio sp.]|nr:TonB-dependent receptor [Cellvibrio sp.]